jgi:hypothetical protein
VNRFLILVAGFAAGAATVIVGEVVAQVANEGTATLECEGDFSEGGQLDCTIHDLVTVPVTTTPSPTTQAATTTTTPPTTSTIPTTTQPPKDVAFFEDFTGDTINDFTARFDWSVVDLLRRSNGWQGHHNEMCENPSTERHLDHIWPASNSNPGEEFWLCGPTGPASDHLMTSNGDNGTFGITAFTPKQTFSRATAKRVCWDVNLTVSRGRRLWWEVQLVNAQAVANNRSLASQGLLVGDVDFERGTAFIGYGRGVDGTMMKRPWPADSLVFDFTEEMVVIWKGQSNRWSEPYSHRFVTEDRAARYQNCLIDNGNNTVSFTQERPGGVYTGTATDASFPDTYRVIFSAHNYNAGKDGTQPFQTWHWDDILVAGK